MTWSEELKKIKAEKDLTVPAMAGKIGVPRRTLENWLGGINTPNEFVRTMVIEKLNK